jgi:predicted HicB family RNase H-like nuclease
MIEYKGYRAHFDFDEKTNLFYGKVSTTSYPLTFQGKSVKEASQAFRDSIDEYLEWCKKYGEKPGKPIHDPIKVEIA